MHASLRKDAAKAKKRCARSHPAVGQRVGASEDPCEERTVPFTPGAKRGELLLYASLVRQLHTHTTC